MHQILPAFIADLNFGSEFTYPAFSILATLVPTSDKQVLYRLLVMRLTIYLCDTYSIYRRKNLLHVTALMWNHQIFTLKSFDSSGKGLCRGKEENILLNSSGRSGKFL